MKEFIEEVKQLLTNARKKVYIATAHAMVECYWQIGKRIVKQEQQGQDRAAYGKEIIQQLANELGTGYSTRTLRDIRKCYLTFPQWEDLAHVCAKLEWSHIRQLPEYQTPRRDNTITRSRSTELGSGNTRAQHQYAILPTSDFIAGSTACAGGDEGKNAYTRAG